MLPKYFQCRQTQDLHKQLYKKQRPVLKRREMITRESDPLEIDLFIHLFTHSFSRILTSAYDRLGPVLGIGNTMVNKSRACSLVRKTVIYQMISLVNTCTCINHD